MNLYIENSKFNQKPVIYLWFDYLRFNPISIDHRLSDHWNGWERTSFLKSKDIKLI